MPYVHTKLSIPKNKDRRIKLTKSQKEEIYNLYNLYGAYSQRELAAMYEVSRRLITFIIDPSKLEQCLQRREERGGSKQYYCKEKRRLHMKSHRSYKQQLYLNNELVEKNVN